VLEANITMAASNAQARVRATGEASWKEKTTALLTAAKDAEAGKEGAGAALMKAANCMACHSAHKGG